MLVSWAKLKLLGFYEDSNIVHRRANKIYENNLTMQAIYTAQRIELLVLRAMYVQTFLNNFIITADLETIIKWEKVLKITADPLTEDLEFRRERIINHRASMNSMYTRLWLAQLLHDRLPNTQIYFEIIYNEYIVSIKIFSHSREDVRIFNDLILFLEKIIPANMVLRTNLWTPYTHIYLNYFFRQEQLKEFTFGTLSKYAHENIL
jgi:hypothetical protein